MLFFSWTSTVVIVKIGENSIITIITILKMDIVVISRRTLNVKCVHKCVLYVRTLGVWIVICIPQITCKLETWCFVKGVF